MFHRLVTFDRGEFVIKNITKCYYWFFEDGRLKSRGAVNCCNKIRVLYKELKIKNLEDLEKAATAGQIRVLTGFGEKSEEKILRGVEFLKFFVVSARTVSEH